MGPLLYMDLPESDTVQKHLMDTRITVQLGMERNSHLIFIGGADDVPVNLCKNFRIFADAVNIRGADKGHRYFTDMGEASAGVKTSKLASVSIAADSDGHGAEIDMVIIGEFFSEEDQPGTGGKDGKPFLNFCFEGVEHIQFL